MKSKATVKKWRRLDNTAKIFPVIANESMSQVFRISATLKEEIRPELLQQALEEILPHMDHFRVRLRRGLFWYYFEENTRTPVVQKEKRYPCRYIDPYSNRQFLFRVTYYERRINLEIFHALTDGLGAANFLKKLTCRYLHLTKGDAGEQVLKEEAQPSRNFFVEDSYLKNYRDIPHGSYSSRPAFRLEGNYLPFGTAQILHIYTDLGEIKQVCHGYGVSITKYLAAALIWSIWQEYLEGAAWDQPVVLNLPINLRAFFGSDTMANFFAVTMIGYLFREPGMDFARLLGIVSRQMDRKIDKQHLEECISYNVSNEKKWYLRVTPLVIKSAVLRVIFWLKDRAYTMTLSNIGPVQVEEPYRDEIERFHVIIGVSRRQPMKCTACAYGRELVITFASVFSDNHLQHRFMEKLHEDGISLKVEGNDPSAARKRDMYPRIRRVLVRRKGGEAKASRMVKQVGKTGGTIARGTREYLAGSRDWKEELKRRLHV